MTGSLRRLRELADALYAELTHVLGCALWRAGVCSRATKEAHMWLPVRVQSTPVTMTGDRFADCKSSRLGPRW